MTKQEATKIIELAFGRILRIGARPTQPGDVEEYERCRVLIMEAKEAIERYETK